MKAQDSQAQQPGTDNWQGKLTAVIPVDDKINALDQALQALDQHRLDDVATFQKRVDGVEAAQKVTDQNVEVLRQHQNETVNRVNEVSGRVAEVATDVQSLRGQMSEVKEHGRGGWTWQTWFADVLDRVHGFARRDWIRQNFVSKQELDNEVDQALAAHGFPRKVPTINADGMPQKARPVSAITGALALSEADGGNTPPPPFNGQGRVPAVPGWLISVVTVGVFGLIFGGAYASTAQRRPARIPQVVEAANCEVLDEFQGQGKAVSPPRPTWERVRIAVTAAAVSTAILFFIAVPLLK